MSLVKIRLTRKFFIVLFIVGCSAPDRKTPVSNEDTYDSVLQTGWYFVAENDTGFKRQLDKDTANFFINPAPIVTPKNFLTFKIYESIYGDMVLEIQLDSDGADAWSEATRKATGKALAFILKDKLLYVPLVNGQIISGKAVLNRGNYTREELETFMKLIEEDC